MNTVYKLDNKKKITYKIYRSNTEGRFRAINTSNHNSLKTFRFKQKMIK